VNSAPDFDIPACFAALDAQRLERGLTWSRVARELWAQTPELNARRDDHPISPSTITGMAKRGDTTCQHALCMLRWLGRVPEDFVPGVVVGARHALPPVDGAHRLRWSLRKLYDALDERRHEHAMTWPAVAAELRCSPNQLTGIRTAKYAIGMRLGMRICGWLDRPAADFVYPAEW
jgi:hypothetical protein